MEEYMYGSMCTVLFTVLRTGQSDYTLWVGLFCVLLCTENCTSYTDCSWYFGCGNMPCIRQQFSYLIFLHTTTESTEWMRIECSVEHYTMNVHTQTQWNRAIWLSTRRRRRYEPNFSAVLSRDEVFCRQRRALGECRVVSGGFLLQSYIYIFIFIFRLICWLVGFV